MKFRTRQELTKQDTCRNRGGRPYEQRLWNTRFPMKQNPSIHKTGIPLSLCTPHILTVGTGSIRTACGAPPGRERVIPLGVLAFGFSLRHPGCGGILLISELAPLWDQRSNAQILRRVNVL